MVSSASVGPSPAAAAASASATAAFRGAAATTGRSGGGFPGWRGEQPGGEAKQCKTRVAQETTAPEPNFRELFVVDFCFEFLHPGPIQRHTRLPPFDRFFFRDLYGSTVLCPGVFGFHELQQGWCAPEQVDLAGHGPTFDFDGERCAFEIQ